MFKTHVQNKLDADQFTYKYKLHSDSSGKIRVVKEDVYVRTDGERVSIESK
jgi:hypothetical protein